MCTWPLDYVHTVSFSLAFYIVFHPQGIRKQMKTLRKRHRAHSLRPRKHGNVSLRFCIVYCSQGNREQPAHYLKQYKNAGKRFRVYGT